MRVTANHGDVGLLDGSRRAERPNVVLARWNKLRFESFYFLTSQWGAFRARGHGRYSMLRILTTHPMRQKAKRSTSAVAAAQVCAYVGRNFAGSRPELDWSNTGP
jgi:hypothetical protein